mmetsp:Transcript_9463/g.12280  ORF Transcript_9463/g.12280 Transcript_9463/m.12280 type:complete len:94 (-) Transcript_9463:89-370(-)
MHVARELDIGNCGTLDDSTLVNLSASCSGLVMLSVENAGEITDASVSSFPVSLTKLEHLNLSGCLQVTREMISSLVDAHISVVHHFAPFPRQR